MLQWIIEFFRSLFGSSSSSSEPAPALSSGSSNSNDHAAKLKASGQIRGLEHVEGAENIRVVSGNVIRSMEGAALVEDPDDGSRHWSRTWNMDISPSKWKDEWGPIKGKDDADTFWYHKYEFDLAQAGDPEEAEAKIKGFGYRDVGHYFQVEITLTKYYGTPDSSEDTLSAFILDSGIVMKAAMGGMQKKIAADGAAAIAANPELLAPFEGVDLDTYALCAAKSAGGMGQAEFTALLASKGMDVAKWTRVNAEWTDRMAKDTSLAIVNAYSKAFAGAGAGSYGGAAQAAGQALGTTNVAGGGEPVPFEKLCEIQGAMSAWSKTGQDVNAMLKHTFNMTAVDWSSISMWWMQKMMNDMTLMGRYNTESEKYEAQYSAGATSAKTDEDLSF